MHAFSFLLAIFSLLWGSAFADGGWNPALEGAYQVTLDCPDTEPLCTALVNGDELVILNTLTPAGVIAAVMNTRDGWDIYRFSAVRFDAATNTLSGPGKHRTRLKEHVVDFRLQIQGGDVTGYIDDSRLSRPIKVTGKSSLSLPFFSVAQPPALASLLGKYRSIHSPSHGSFWLRPRAVAENGVIGVYQSPAGSSIGFPIAHYDASTGILELVHQTRHGYLKWVLSAIGDGAGIHLKGAGVSAINGRVYPVEFSLIKDDPRLE